MSKSKMLIASVIKRLQEKILVVDYNKNRTFKIFKIIAASRMLSSATLRAATEESLGCEFAT
jgi:hypothetical protein